MATTNITTTASFNPTQPEVKLPSVSLPTFSGAEYKNVDNFWNKFVDAVDANAAIPKTIKFTYLQGQLRGEALKVVCNLTLSNDGYDSAVQLVKKNYADLERAATLLVKSFLDLPSMDGTTDLIQAFRVALKSLLKALSHKIVVKCKLASEILDKLCTLHNKASLTVKDITEGLRSVIEQQRANRL
ncbi:uncharacterized protein [Procambarus clarkii]|uniref:uncharacterized protein n=1 Tax=Procambarus clarkii TaxID=6728 RepID=UPI0037437A9A